MPESKSATRHRRSPKGQLRSIEYSQQHGGFGLAGASFRQVRWPCWCVGTGVGRGFGLAAMPLAFADTTGSAGSTGTGKPEASTATGSSTKATASARRSGRGDHPPRRPARPDAAVRGGGAPAAAAPSRRNNSAPRGRQRRARRGPPSRRRRQYSRPPVRDLGAVDDNAVVVGVATGKVAADDSPVAPAASVPRRPWLHPSSRQPRVRLRPRLRPARWAQICCPGWVLAPAVASPIAAPLMWTLAATRRELGAAAKTAKPAAAFHQSK